ncbi:hypothetical protein [Campylobacter helveticus]|uniref:hypothetical protein n=1 Tax=Campylobacter helveticus TaxID=28898 RepID=UPI0022EA256F|nr:hypothetical protein [Campylobacter helveticus]
MIRKELAKDIKKKLKELSFLIDELYTTYEEDYYKSALVKGMLNNTQDIKETIERLGL